MCLVSVVIPTFGRPDMVSRAIRSALAQTVQNIEVIVVVDGDDDLTRTAIAAIDDPRVRRFDHVEKRGAGHARDTGVEHSRGGWIAFLDDDDEWEPEKTARQLACVDAHGGPAIVMSVSKVVSSYGSFHRPGEIYDNEMPIDEWLFDRRTWTRGGQSFLQTSSLMLPRALMATLKFADARHEEWELAIRAVKDGGYALLTDVMPSVTYYVPERRAALSRSYTWHSSLEWAISARALLSPRAFSGFCLTTVAQDAASVGDRSAFFPLLRAAFRQGAPTARQLSAFAFYWICPEPMRRRLRAIMQGLK